MQKNALSRYRHSCIRLYFGAFSGACLPLLFTAHRVINCVKLIPFFPYPTYLHTYIIYVQVVLFLFTQSLIPIACLHTSTSSMSQTFVFVVYTSISGRSISVCRCTCVYECGGALTQVYNMEQTDELSSKLKHKNASLTSTKALYVP